MLLKSDGISNDDEDDNDDSACDDDEGRYDGAAGTSWYGIDGDDTEGSVDGRCSPIVV